MKIEDKRKDADRVPFSSLRAGDVFQYGGYFLQKRYTATSSNGKYTAQVLSDGCGFALLDNDLVTPLPNARLVIE